MLQTAGDFRLADDIGTPYPGGQRDGSKPQRGYIWKEKVDQKILKTLNTLGCTDIVCKPEVTCSR